MIFTKQMEEAAKVLGDAIAGDYRAQGLIKAVAQGDVAEALTTSDLALVGRWSACADLAWSSRKFTTP